MRSTGSLFSFSRKDRARAVEEFAERNSELRVFVSDIRCQLLVTDRAGTEVLNIDEGGQYAVGAVDMLTSAIARLSPEIENSIGNVLIFLDDPEISIIDSRLAKITHFEERSLSEYGKYQLGGKQSAFASYTYGTTSQQEAEKRLVAYIPEEKLTAVLFALGRLAKFATFFGPWAMQTALAGSGEEPAACLAVHGEFSVLALTNPAAGSVAIRTLPVGISSLVTAYGDEFGLSAADAGVALQAKPRLTSNALRAEELTVGSQHALVPPLRQLAGEVHNTADYFEYQRLSGRASTLALWPPVGAVAGFSKWIGELLDIECNEGNRAAHPPRALNFLEGMRSGLLKLGTQLYDFTGGRFVPSGPDGTGSRSGLGGLAGKGSIRDTLKAFSGKSMDLKDLKPLALPAGGVVAFLVLVWGLNAFWLEPITDNLEMSQTAYQTTLTGFAQKQAMTAAPAAEPVSWARDIMTIAAAMAYDMKLAQMSLTAARPGAPAMFQLAGTLPKDGNDNFQLIGRFMSRLSANAAVQRRLGALTFQGAEADNKETSTLKFHFTANVAGGAAP